MDINDLVFLQVRGKNQLAKELEETKHLKGLKEIRYYADAINKNDPNVFTRDNMIQDSKDN